MPEKFVVDSESVRGLAKLLEETGLTEIEYQMGTQRIRVVRGTTSESYTHYHPSTPPHSSPIPPSQQGETSVLSVSQGETITSPMVGTVYLAMEPGGVPFIKVGKKVKKGDTLLIVEAMKVMNPIRAAREGKVLEICAQDTKPVEFGEALVILE